MVKENVIKIKRFHSRAKCLNTKPQELRAVLEKVLYPGDTHTG